MTMPIPEPDRLPFTADHYRFAGKPAALIPGRCGVVYDSVPRVIPWTEMLRLGTPISKQQFDILLYSQS